MPNHIRHWRRRELNIGCMKHYYSCSHGLDDFPTSLRLFLFTGELICYSGCRFCTVLDSRRRLRVFNPLYGQAGCNVYASRGSRTAASAIAVYSCRFFCRACPTFSRLPGNQVFVFAWHLETTYSVTYTPRIIRNVYILVDPMWLRSYTCISSLTRSFEQTCIPLQVVTNTSRTSL